MVITAWAVDKSSEEMAMRRVAEIALDSAALLHEHVDVASWAIETTASVPDKRHRARALIGVANAAAEHGLHDQAMRLVVEAFLAARDAGREAVVEVFGESAGILAEIDGGETLSRMYEELRRADSWLRTS